MLSAILVLPAMAQSPSTFSGKLDGRLHIDPRSPKIRAWDETTRDEANKLGISLKGGDRIFKGSFELTHDFPEPPDSLFALLGAVVQSADGSDALYVDLNKNGRFEENERFPFQPVDESYPGFKSFKSHVGLELPLASGPYRRCPIEVALYRPGAQVFWPVGPKQMPIIYSSDYFVEGSVQLPERSLLMRFEYDFKQDRIDLEDGAEWADIDGDGEIDLSPGSPEVLRAKGKSPEFQVGKLVLSAQSVDPSTNTFLLKSVPLAEYHKIDLLVGSTLPDFAYTDFSGKKHHLSEIKAHYLLLDFWATWCGACMADMPSKIKTYEEFHGRGFEILGMDGAEENLDTPQKLLEKMKVAWPQAQYDKELFENKLQITVWPTLVLLDADRKIVSIGNGQLSLYGEGLNKTLKTLLPDR
jgi:thiol-disulfide isomerase/thioredoxin